MDGQAVHVFLWFCATAAVYALLARGAFRAGEPLRYQMLDLAKEVVHDRRAPASVKDGIVAALDDVYSSRAAWRLTLHLYALPVVFPLHGLRAHYDADDMLPADLRQKVRDIQVRWMVATLLNSPAALLLCGFVTFILIAFTISLHTISQRLMFRDHSRDPAHA